MSPEEAQPNIVRQNLVLGRVVEKAQSPAKLRTRVYYEITPHCNLTCIHCSSLTDGLNEVLTADEIVHTHLALTGWGVKGAVITGGEPFVRKDCIEIVDRLATVGSVVVTTNGTIMPMAELTTVMKQYPHVLIQFSWDGVTKATFEQVRGKGTFDRASKSLQCLVEQGLGRQLALSMTVMRVNFHEVEDMFRFALERGVGVVHLPGFLPVGKALDHWAELALSSDQLYRLCQTILDATERYKRKLRISSNLLQRIRARSRHGDEVDCLNNFMIKIGPTGLILPCPAASDPGLALGNVRSFDMTQDLLLALQNWRSELVAGGAYRERFECRQCNWYQVCGGRFCDNCGLLSVEPYEPAIETMCHVCQKLYHECAIALRWSGQLQ